MKPKYIITIEKLLSEKYKKQISIKSFLSFGNKKLSNSTAILNITSALQCPSRKLGLCGLSDPSKCYALRSERIYL